jgi:hypothetical protein
MLVLRVHVVGCRMIVDLGLGLRCLQYDVLVARVSSWWIQGLEGPQVSPLLNPRVGQCRRLALSFRATGSL